MSDKKVKIPNVLIIEKPDKLFIIEDDKIENTIDVILKEKQNKQDFE